MIITLKKQHNIKQVKIGFSWTTLFFGMFVPLVRQDWTSFFIMGIITMLSIIFPIIGLIMIALPFMYNRHYIKSLLKGGYKPANKTSKDILDTEGF